MTDRAYIIFFKTYFNQDHFDKPCTLPVCPKGHETNNTNV